MNPAADQIRIKRVYDPPEPGDGFRILVDRLWPRGLTREKAKADLWLKQVAPSTELRRWYAHDPEHWPEFRKRYLAELRDNPALDELLALARKHVKHPAPPHQPSAGLTLLYGARTVNFNHALVLRELILADTPHSGPKP